MAISPGLILTRWQHNQTIETNRTKGQTNCLAFLFLTMTYRQQLHANCVLVETIGVLITGESGSGKSALTADLMALGARLVADDQVILEAQQGELIASAPGPIRGLMELYGFGIVEVEALSVASAKVGLELRCLPDMPVDRLPEAVFSNFECVSVPSIAVDPFHRSTASKILLFCHALSAKNASTGA